MVSPCSTNIGAHHDSLHLKDNLFLPLCENRLGAHQVSSWPLDLSSSPTWEHIRTHYVSGKPTFYARNDYIQGQTQEVFSSRDIVQSTVWLIKSKDNILGIITSRDNPHSMPRMITSKDNLTRLIMSQAKICSMLGLITSRDNLYFFPCEISFRCICVFRSSYHL